MANEIDLYRAKVHQVRGKLVMLDRDLSTFYKVESRVLNQVRRRNEEALNGEAFQLTKEEYQEILGHPAKGHLPWVYSERASYKIAFLMDTKVAVKVADLILDVFISVRDHKLVPALSDKKIEQLEKRIETLENQMLGKVSNNFHGTVNLIQGHNNQVVINDIENVLHNLQAQIPKDDSDLTKKMDELIGVIKEGKKEKISSYVKKTNDAIDLLTKAGPAALVVKSAISLVRAFFNI